MNLISKIFQYLLLLCGISFSFVEGDFIKDPVTFTPVTQEFLFYDLSEPNNSYNGMLNLNIRSDEGTITYNGGLNEDGSLPTAESFNIISWKASPGVIFIKGYEVTSRNIFVAELRYDQISANFAMHIYRYNGFSLIHSGITKIEEVPEDDESDELEETDG